MNFFKNLKNKVDERLFASDEDYDEDEVNKEDYKNDSGKESMFEGEVNPPEYNNYSYSPTASMNAPEYKSEKKSNITPPEYNPSAFSGEKKGGTIYNMSSLRPTNKFKLNSITLHEIYGAKEVALLMMEKDTIIIVNFAPLPEAQKRRAMDFLDGARCITNAIFAKLSENIFVFVPENVELQGDFESQVDLSSIR